MKDRAVYLLAWFLILGSVSYLNMQDIYTNQSEKINSKININQASIEDLKFLPRLSASLVKRIIAERERLGGFSSLEQISLIKGVGPKTLLKLREFVKIN